MNDKSTSAPIYDRQYLISAVAAARVGGSKIILANGCFDLIHVGHVRYLEGAKALGGFLVVGINSDHHVRQLKGEGRPFMPENERAEIIAAFKFADAVTIFDEPTVEQLILDIRPDFHAKGTDYTEDSVPERQTIASVGGKVAIVGDPKDHSSSAMLRQIVTG